VGRQTWVPNDRARNDWLPTRDWSAQDRQDMCEGEPEPDLGPIAAVRSKRPKRSEFTSGRSAQLLPRQRPPRAALYSCTVPTSMKPRHPPLGLGTPGTVRLSHSPLEPEQFLGHTAVVLRVDRAERRRQLLSLVLWLYPASWSLYLGHADKGGPSLFKSPSTSQK
jgi:hypothetical protein